MTPICLHNVSHVTTFLWLIFRVYSLIYQCLYSWLRWNLLSFDILASTYQLMSTGYPATFIYNNVDIWLIAFSSMPMPRWTDIVWNCMEEEPCDMSQLWLLLFYFADLHTRHTCTSLYLHAIEICQYGLANFSPKLRGLSSIIFIYIR